MKGFISILNVALNVGGIFASLFGIVCVVKIAFIKPWQNLQVSSERITFVETPTETEVSGQNRPEPETRTVELPVPVAVAETTRQPVIASPKPAAVEVAATPTPVGNTAPSEVTYGVTELPPLDRVPSKSVQGTVPEVIEAKVRKRPNGFLAWLFRAPGEEAPKEEEMPREPMELRNRGGAAVDYVSSSIDPTEGQFSAEPMTEVPIAVEQPRRVTATPPAADLVQKVQGGALNHSFSIALLEGYLKSLGYTNISQEDTGLYTKVYGVKDHNITVELNNSVTESGREQTVAMEGIALVVHPDNPIETLTVAQVAAIYSGDILRWSQLCDFPGSISLCMSDGKAGTPHMLKRLVLYPNGKLDTENGEISHYGSGSEVAEKVAAKPLAIGVIPISQQIEGVKYIKIKAAEDCRAIPPTHICAETMDYPLAKPVNFYLNSEDGEFINDWLQFVMSDAGQEVVNEIGLIGRGELSDFAMAQHDRFVRETLEDKTALPSYRNMIKGADRLNSRYNLRFQNGEMILTENSEVNLSNLIKWLLEQDRPVTPILIGFSDSIGKYKVNQDLSRKRAEVVADRLRESGIPNVKTAGYGEEMPVGDNGTEAGRAINRRVEVWLHR
ncbi:MAG: phosphate ABC transporter substrate-binding/OmpA family protein [Verrucomicrobiales bacterium]|nr:phosphate ABC transporter substrate-binding/OmpA family protein [Verrucomicrobiales bacterium]